MHISYSSNDIVPSRGSVPVGDGRRPFPGLIDAMRKYLHSCFSIFAVQILHLLRAVGATSTMATPTSA